jgi:hypothetical protein
LPTANASERQLGIFELVSVPPDSEGNVFESVDIREYVLPTGIIESRVLVDTAKAVVRGLISWQTAVDHAFDTTTCDVCDAGKRLFTADFKKKITVTRTRNKMPSGLLGSGWFFMGSTI